MCIPLQQGALHLQSAHAADLPRPHSRRCPSDPPVVGIWSDAVRAGRQVRSNPSQRIQSGAPKDMAQRGMTIRSRSREPPQEQGTPRCGSSAGRLQQRDRLLGRVEAIGTSAQSRLPDQLELQHHQGTSPVQRPHRDFGPQRITESPYIARSLGNRSSESRVVPTPIALRKSRALWPFRIAAVLIQTGVSRDREA